MRDILDFQGKRTVVTGCATGMGESVARTLAELGADVIGCDVKPMVGQYKQTIELDLSDEASTDAVAAQIEGDVDALFNCAGIPGPPFSNLDTVLVNFVGLRHFTEALLPQIKRGGSVSSITSVAGMGFEANLENVNALLDIPGFADSRAWCEARPEVANGYLFSKQMIIGYTMRRAHQLAEREIRINCLSPAPTETPMLSSFHDQVSKSFMDEHFQAPVGRDAKPEEMAEPLIFLGSNAARFISGHNLIVDYGYWGSVLMGNRPRLL